MAGTSTGAKKYVVKLSAEERERLEALISSGKRSAQLITKARILLKADASEAGEGWTIAAALDTSVNTVGSTRRQLVEEGFEATLLRKYNPNSARPRIFDGAAEAKLIALACSPAPEGFARQDNLSTHTAASLYVAFPPEEARRLAKRFEWHYTPKHGSWLDMAESELAVLTNQCLDRRIPDKPTLAKEIAAWEAHRNKHHAKADWQFTTNDARVKLKRLYPQF